MLLYFRSFIYRFAERTFELKLAKNSQPFSLAKVQKELQYLKQFIHNKPYLKTPSIHDEIQIYTDYSNYGIAGCCVFRELETKKLIPFHFISKTTTPAESLLTAIEGEALAIRYVIKRIGKELLLYLNIIFFCDQQPLVTAINSDVTSAPMSDSLKKKVLAIQS